MIMSENIDAETLMLKAGLTDALKGENKYYNIDYLSKIITFDLGNEEIRKKMFDEKEINPTGGYGRSSNHILKKVFLRGIQRI